MPARVALHSALLSLLARVALLAPVVQKYMCVVTCHFLFLCLLLRCFTGVLYTLFVSHHACLCATSARVAALLSTLLC
jgi:hypothetical protein